MESTHPVLFLSNYYPPEVNALANRTSDHARTWAAAGGSVEIMAGPPHFPEGYVYPGYANRWCRNREDGVTVTRIPMYVARNAGFGRRVLSYLSYLISATAMAERAVVRPGVVVASSPQFFAGLAGWAVASRLRRPFVLEVRDLWPDSIVDVGAMRRGPVVRALEWLETWLYRAADHVVIVSPAFRGHIEARGVPPSRISVLTNGVDLGFFQTKPEESSLADLRKKLDLEGRYVVSYIGTVGMAHGAEVLIEAARLSQDPELCFVVAGAGAEWQRLRATAETEGLTNVRVLPKQSRERVRLLYELTDVSVVHLRDRPAFRKVIPSKMFESMAARRPVVLGVRGQAEDILNTAGAGLPIAPDSPHELLDAVLRLKHDTELRLRMGELGAEHVADHYDRDVLARRYWSLLQSVAASR